MENVSSDLDFDAKSTNSNLNFFNFGSLQLESLSELEKNLDLYEKVSLVFLLIDPIDDAIACLESIISDSSREFLKTWAQRKSSYWKEALVEALLIIKNLEVLFDLGIDLDMAKNHFMAHTMNKQSMYIHPMKKILYTICEELNEINTKKLVNDIKTAQKINVESVDYEYMECFILKMIKQKIIQIGSWSPWQDVLEDNIQCNVQNIAVHLVDCYKDMHQELIKVQDFINQRIKYKYKQFMINQNKKLERYQIINKNNIGYFLIISNKHFMKSDLELKERKGTENDVNALKRCWKKFGFDVVVFEDLGHNDFHVIINSYLDMIPNEHSMFAVCILSHGTKGLIYGSDSVPVNINYLKDLLCKHKKLTGKPKLMIIQACRGDKIMNAVHAPRTNYQERPLETDGVCLSVQDKIPERADLLVFWATVENYVSFRDVNEGTWFIQLLCTWMLQYGDKHHLSDVFTIVTSELSNKGYQVSQTESTFRKQVWLSKSED